MTDATTVRYRNTVLYDHGGKKGTGDVLLHQDGTWSASNGDEDVVDDCKRKCDERDGCTHFVSWANQACFTYEACDATDDGAAVDSTERVYVNVYRTKGKCEYGKSAPGPKSMGWN